MANSARIVVDWQTKETVELPLIGYHSGVNPTRLRGWVVKGIKSAIAELNGWVVKFHEAKTTPATLVDFVGSDDDLDSVTLEVKPILGFSFYGLDRKVALRGEGNFPIINCVANSTIGLLLEGFFFKTIAAHCTIDCLINKIS